MVVGHVRTTSAGAGSSKALAKSLDLLCDIISNVCNSSKDIKQGPCERARASKLGLRIPVSDMYTSSSFKISMINVHLWYTYCTVGWYANCFQEDSIFGYYERPLFFDKTDIFFMFMNAVSHGLELEIVKQNWLIAKCRSRKRSFSLAWLH